MLINWIEHVRNTNGYSLLESIQIALNQVVGAYSLIILDQEENAMYAVRKGAQLVIGVGQDEYIVATDSTPINAFTDKVINMEEEDVYRLVPGKKVEVLNLKNIEKSPVIEKLEEALDIIEKDGFAHFMLKEIYEQPKAIVDSYRGRLNATEAWVRLGGITEYRNKLNKASRIIFGACGTSWHAALVGEYLIEEMARIPVEVEYASEFRYRNPIMVAKMCLLLYLNRAKQLIRLRAIELCKKRSKR